MCKDDGLGAISLTTPFAGAASVVLKSGGNRYCAELGGSEKKNDPLGLKRKDAPAPGACPVTVCTGYPYAGGCWYEAVGVSCNAECAAQGRVYSDLTRTIAGSDGTNAACQALIAHFGWAEPFNPDLECGDGYGCARDSTITARCATPTTSSTAGAVGLGRICACE